MRKIKAYFERDTDQEVYGMPCRICRNRKWKYWEFPCDCCLYREARMIPRVEYTEIDGTWMKKEE
jgi:hypothetical protein